MARKRNAIRQFLNRIYGFSFFNKMLLLAPVYSVFMQDNGMTDMQLSSLFIILSVGIIASQIPVTWLANKIGHKYSIIFGQFLKAAAFILWLFVPTFWGFAVGMFLWGTQTAIYNVSFETVVYDELSARHHRNLYARVLGVIYNIQAMAVAFAASGSLLMFFGYEWITLASVTALVVSSLFILSIKFKHKKTKEPKKAKKIRSISFIKTAFRICRKMPCIFMVAMVLWLFSNFAYLDDYLSLIGVEIGLPVEYVGIVSFFCLGCSVLGQTFAYRFSKIKDWILYTAICALGISFVAFSVFYSVSGLLFLGIGYVLLSGLFVLLFARLQDFIPTSHRPVMLSLYSIGDNVSYVLMCLLIGFGGSLGSWRYGVLFAGLILVLTGLWALLFVKDKCAYEPNKTGKIFKTMRPGGSDIV